MIQRPPQAINPAGQRQTEIGKHYSPVQWTRQFWSQQYGFYIYIFQFPVWVVHKKGPRAAGHFSLFQFSLRTSSRKQIGDCE